MNHSTNPLHADHSRQFEQNRYVYPVLSRRSRGLSLGVNLNPDKICNFDCIYCQVNRRTEAETTFVDLPAVLRELDDLLSLIASGEIYQHPKFANVPDELRRLNDIAFSGDGEPTTYRNFDEIISQVASLKKQHQLDDTKLVLITNASMFHRPAVQNGLKLMDENNGEIWAKLDAGTEEYYHFIERTKIPFQQILDNIRDAAKVRPLVIQSLLMRVNDVPPSEAEIAAFCERLNDITSAGGQLKLIQIYTVARTPAESYVSCLEDEEVDRIADTVRERTGLTVESYYGRKT
ncbi:MAG: radical SAM protein [Planctomycetaceae bacterium]|nr:radical SAM protein [Planctomycetaceae bacterium]